MESALTGRGQRAVRPPNLEVNRRPQTRCREPPDSSGAGTEAVVLALQVPSELEFWVAHGVAGSGPAVRNAVAAEHGNLPDGLEPGLGGVGQPADREMVDAEELVPKERHLDHRGLAINASVVEGCDIGQREARRGQPSCGDLSGGLSTPGVADDEEFPVAGADSRARSRNSLK